MLHVGLIYPLALEKINFRQQHYWWDVSSGKLKVIIDQLPNKLNGIGLESLTDDSFDVFSIPKSSCRGVPLNNGFKILSFRSISK